MYLSLTQIISHRQTEGLLESRKVCLSLRVQTESEDAERAIGRSRNGRDSYASWRWAETAVIGASCRDEPFQPVVAEADKRLQQLDWQDAGRACPKTRETDGSTSFIQKDAENDLDVERKFH